MNRKYAESYWRRLKSLLFSPLCGISLLTSVAVGAMQYKGTSWLDRLYDYQAGVPYVFMEPIDLARLMTWLLPHLLLSVAIGQYAENALISARYALPRYGSAFRWWIDQTLAIWGGVVLYYVAVYGSVLLFSFVGNPAALKIPPVTAHSSAASILWTMSIQTVFTMIVLITIQLSVHMCSRNVVAAAGSFIGITMLSAFIPSPDYARFAIGNWMMYERSQMAAGASGYNPDMSIVASACLIVLICSATWTALRLRNNHW